MIPRKSDKYQAIIHFPNQSIKLHNLTGPYRAAYFTKLRKKYSVVNVARGKMGGEKRGNIF